jgi:Zn-dependent oligopeptidase
MNVFKKYEISGTKEKDTKKSLEKLRKKFERKGIDINNFTKKDIPQIVTYMSNVMDIANNN